MDRDRHEFRPVSSAASDGGTGDSISNQHNQEQLRAGVGVPAQQIPRPGVPAKAGLLDGRHLLQVAIAEPPYSKRGLHLAMCNTLASAILVGLSWRSG